MLHGHLQQLLPLVLPDEWGQHLQDVVLEDSICVHRRVMYNRVVDGLTDGLVQGHDDHLELGHVVGDVEGLEHLFCLLKPRVWIFWPERGQFIVAAGLAVGRALCGGQGHVER